MIENLKVNAMVIELDEDLMKYVQKKIANLDKYIPKNARESVHVEVWLKDAKAKDKKQLTCEVKMTLPKEIIVTKESTLNIYAAIDIVEAKLKNQILRYKSLHSNSKIRHTINLIKNKRAINQ